MFQSVYSSLTELDWLWFSNYLGYFGLKEDILLKLKILKCFIKIRSITLWAYKSRYILKLCYNHRPLAARSRDLTKKKKRKRQFFQPKVMVKWMLTATLVNIMWCATIYYYIQLKLFRPLLKRFVSSVCLDLSAINFVQNLHVRSVNILFSRNV